MIKVTNFRTNTVYVFTFALISTMTLISATIATNVYAADKEGPGYSCNHIPGMDLYLIILNNIESI